MTDIDEGKLREMVRLAVRDAICDILEVDQNDFRSGVSDLRDTIRSHVDARERRSEVSKSMWSKGTEMLTGGVLAAAGTWLAVHFLGQTK